MTTHVTSHNPVRSDLPAADAAASGTSRTWTLAGIGAGLAGIGTIVTSGMIDAVYDPELAGEPQAVVDALADRTSAMLAFHTFTVVGAVLLVLFAAGVHRRLRATSGETSLVPLVAFSGLFGTAIVSVLGSGLDTEFVFALMDDQDVVDPANIALYNHWIGTIPWLWVLAGLSGLALFAAGRAGQAPRWIGLVGLVLGGLTLLLGLSPLQYMAGMTGPLMVLVIALGFCFGDRTFQR